MDTGIVNKIADIYELTPLQEGILFYDKLKESEGAYFSQDVMTIHKKNTNLEQLKKAFQMLSLKHEVLRTKILSDSMEKPYQVVLKSMELECSERDISKADNREEIFAKILKEDVTRGFDLAKDSLIRMMIVDYSGEDYKIIFSSHHIILDGWSTSILRASFTDMYCQLRCGVTEEQICKEIKEYQVNVAAYGDYVRNLKEKDTEEGLRYWDNLLKDYEGSAEISPFSWQDDLLEPVRKVILKVSDFLSEKVRAFCQKEKITMNTVAEAALGIVLQRYNRTNDVVFGKVVSGRGDDIKGIEEIAGMFINTIPQRIKCESGTTLNELLKRIQEQSAESTEYDYVGLADIQSRTESGSELIKTIFAFENYYSKESDSEEELFEHDADRDQTNYNQTFIAYYVDSLYLGCLYKPSRFSEEDITGILKQMEQVIKSIVEHPEQKVVTVDILTDIEKEKILYRFNDTATDYPKNKPVAALLEEQVLRTPEHTAVVYGEEAITYRELNERANQLAVKLRELQVGPDDFVAILTEKSIEMIVGICGILKAGGAYVPIDPAYPEERNRFILKDCKPKALLRSEKEMPFYTGLVEINIKEEDFGAYSTKNPETVNTAEDLAYCIYTSGTTGQPKGSLIPQRGIVRLVKNQTYLKLNESTVIMQTGSMAFDASTLEVWGALLNGGKLILPGEDVLMSSENLKHSLDTFGVNTMWMTSTLFNQMLMLNESLFDNLNYLLIGGEKLSDQHVRIFKNRRNGVTLINGYGPTENTTFTTTYEIPEEFKIIPIGKPISNTRIYILDNGMLCGVGIPGELCTAGDGLARGYLGLEELTREKFLENPFGPGKLYRTGDLVRWLPGGTIEFLGRMDEQVKIRGFRIELGEIENTLRKIDKIRDTAVIARTDDNGEKMLNAYLVSEEKLDMAEIKDILRKELPSNMIPPYMMQIEKIPVNRNGKLSRKELPVIEAAGDLEYIAPENPAQQAVCSIFSEILNVKQVGINDSFFDLGGDSIKAIRVVSKIREEGFTCTVRDIMSCKTPAMIAGNMAANAEMEYDQGEVSGKVELTPIMRWYLELNLKKPEHFNQSVLLKAEKFDKTALKAVLTRLVSHHDMLRAVYRNHELYIRKSGEGKAYDFTEYSIRQMTEAEKLEFIEKTGTSLQGSIDLSEGPLFKAAVFEDDKEEHLLLIIHHLAVDGVSWRILIEDLQKGYEEYKRDQTITLPQKTASFKSWAECLKEYKDSSKLLAERKYWKMAEEKRRECELPVQKKEPREEKVIEVSLDKAYTGKLLANCSRAYGTGINEVLIASLGMAVKKITGQSRITIGMEGHGREKLHKDLSIDRTVGWFTSYYPVVLEIGRDERESIIYAKEMFSEIPNNGIGYGVLKYFTDSGLRSDNPFLTFNYLGEFSEREFSEEEIRDSQYYGGMECAEENDIGTGLSMNGTLKDGILTFELGYDAGKYEDEFIQRLADTYIMCLQLTAGHCKEAAMTPVKTPSDYGLLGMDIHEFETIQKKLGEKKITAKDIYKLTPLQEGMLLSQIDANDGEYFVQSVYRCPGDMKVSTLKDALFLLSEKEEVLKTLFLYDGLLEPVQVIAEKRETELKSVDLSQEADFEGALYDLMAQDVLRGFDLENDTLLRITLVKEKEESYQIIWSMHHIITDGWSMPVFWKNFIELYERLKNGENKEELLKEIQADRDKKSTYGDYVRSLLKKDKEEGLKYWKQLLEGYEGQAAIESTGQKTETCDPVVILEQKVRKEITDKIEAEGRKKGITANTYVETAIGIVLSHYNNTNDVVYGKVVSGRESEVSGIEEMTGMFINTIPQRIQGTDNMTVEELLCKVQKQSVESTKYDYIGLSDIQKAAAGGENLIHTVLAFENYYTAEGGMAAEEGDSTTEFILKDGREQTNYDLDFTAYQSDGLYLMISYNPLKYGEREARQILKRLETVLEQIAESPECKIGELETVTEEEKNCILKEFNGEKKKYPHGKTVMDLFEKQAAKTPDRVAVVYKEESITYKELNRKANQVAKLLKDLGVKEEDFVAVFAERRIEMIIGIYGILKAGGAYVPLDPEYPEDRIRFMLEDCGPKAVLVACPEAAFETERPKIDLCDEKIYEGGAGNPIRKTGENNLAYTIYTSGTTGKPKGVLIEHKGLLNLMAAYTDIYELTEKDVVLQVANYIFDQSVWDIFNILLVGGRLCLVSYDDLRNPEALADYCNEKQVTLASFTPALINELNPTNFKTLRILDSSGEAANGDVLKKWAGRVKVVNTYGPTETTVNASSYYYGGEDFIRLPIGKPLPNTQFYVLKGTRLCGIGIPGELCIAGDGVARGYLNREELTKEKFIDNPFGEGKLYRTGDLARWLPDGNIDCMGRMDEQVKIRGFRIELGEVVSAIRKIQAVKDVVVLVKGDIKSEKSMHAYLVAEEEVAITEIKEELSKSIPEYMIPGYMMQVPEIPVTRSGKVDRRALPDIVVESGEGYIPPSTETEELVARIFKLILSVERVGASDNFFQMGGDSIKAIRVVSKLREAGYPCAVKDIMAERTVQKIAACIHDKKEEKAVYRQEALSGRVEFTPIIRSFFEQKLPRPEYFNQSMMLKAEKLEKDALKAALREVVLHHDMLRAVYRDGGLYIREPEEGKLFDYWEYELDAADGAEMDEFIIEKGTRIQESMNLLEGPLVKAAVFKTDEEEHLLLAIHHLVIDGVSWRILLEDLENGYMSCLETGSISLPDKTASFMEWSALLKEYGTSKKLLKEKEYWEAVAKELPECHMEKQLNRKTEEEAVVMELEEEETYKLLHSSVKAYNTQVNDILLAGLGMAIYEVTGKNKIAVEMEGHGREEIHKEIQVDRTIGWFTSLYPVILRIGEDTAENIIQTKEMFRNVPGNGVGYGVLRNREDSDIQAEEIDISFNYLGDFHEGREEDEWFQTSEYKGGMDEAYENGLENSIMIIGLTEENKLKFSFIYDTGKYEKRFMEKVAAAYHKSLLKIIECCENSAAVTKTASDFNLKGDARKDFDKALKMLDGMI